jgi:hypothetical protein
MSKTSSSELADTVEMFQGESRGRWHRCRETTQRDSTIRSAGSDHWTRSYPGPDDAPLHAATPEEGSSHVSASMTRTRFEAHLGSAMQAPYLVALLSGTKRLELH